MEMAILQCSGACCKAWLLVVQERYEVAFSPEMEQACMKYYSEHYREHFATPVMRDVLACIPSINLWDDHDIFDGWGSYPEPLQMCHVFQGMLCSLSLQSAHLRVWAQACRGPPECPLHILYTSIISVKRSIISVK